MKFLHVIPSLNPTLGGPVEGLKQMSLALCNAGHASDVVVFDDEEDDWLSKSGPFKIHVLGPHHTGYWISFKFIPWLRKHHSDYDVIVVHGIWQFHSFAVWLAMLGAKTPYFVFAHGMLGPWFKKRHPIKHLKKCLYWIFAEYHVVHNARALLFTCEQEMLHAKNSFYPYNINELVVGFGTLPPDNVNTSLMAKYRYPQINNKRVLLFIGRISYIKGCDLLIESFANVCREYESIHLVIAGPDQDNWMKDLVKQSKKLGICERITWVGQLESELKWGVLQSADALILPSHHENFGMVVAEALACGVPVLLTDKVNIWREVVKDGAGFAENDSLEGISRMLKKWLILDAETIVEMKNNAINCFNKRFLMDNVAINLVDIIDRNIR